jgi:hypothetical protein
MSDPRPAPVERWLALSATDTLPSTAVIEGKARFRREGKGLWLPIEAVMWHELGRNHVVDLRVGLGPLTFIRGLDGYVDGSGFSRISHTLDLGPEIDQAALLFMWSEACLFPTAWRDREDVMWATIDEHTADVSLPFGEGYVSARVSFDPQSGYPARFSAERYKGVGSRAVEWTIDYSDWGPTEDDVMLPRQATATWANEPGPWFRMEIQRANLGADVSGALTRGRALLAEAAADPTR